MKAKTKITKEDIYKIERAARREAEIAQGRVSLKSVHKSEKTYNRQRDKKFEWAE